jgi:outer membrane protein OmpA-like peptidoglycan-associated protein
MTSRTRSAPPPIGGRQEHVDDNSVMSGAGFWLIVVIVFIALVTAAVMTGTSKIEDDIADRTTAALRSNGYTAVIAEASGTHVALYGTYSDDQSEEGAVGVVRGVPGVSGVSIELWFVSNAEVEDLIITGQAIEFNWDATSVAVTGDVSNTDRSQFIAETLTPSFGRVDTAGFTVVDGIPDESDWIGTILSLAISARESIEVGRLIVVPDQDLLVLTGDVESKTIRNALNEEVVEAGNAIGFDTNAAVRVPDLAPDVVPPTEEDVEALQIDLDALLRDKVVEFEVNSDVITETGITLLDEILEILRLAPEISVEIAGHADTHGRPSTNLVLSEARAASVLLYLIAQGENPDRYTSVGYGDTQPIADNTTAEGRARNRRIEFRASLEEGT